MEDISKKQLQKGYITVTITNAMVEKITIYDQPEKQKENDPWEDMKSIQTIQK